MKPIFGGKKENVMKTYKMKVMMLFPMDEDDYVSFSVKAEDDDDAIEKAMCKIESPKFYHSDDVNVSTLSIMSSQEIQPN